MSSLSDRIGERSIASLNLPTSGMLGALEEEGMLLPLERCNGRVSSKYSILTSCSLSEAAFAIPSWSSGTLSTGVESLSSADLVSGSESLSLAGLLSRECQLPSPDFWLPSRNCI